MTGRWRSAAEHDWRDPASYASLGIDFVVLEAPHRLQGRVPVFENAKFVVYRTALEGVIGNAPGDATTPAGVTWRPSGGNSPIPQRRYRNQSGALSTIMRKHDRRLARKVT